MNVRPKVKPTQLRVLWAGLACRYRWLIRPPIPCLGIASLAQVSKTGLCPLQNMLTLSDRVPHTHTPCHSHIDVFTSTNTEGVRVRETYRRITAMLDVLFDTCVNAAQTRARHAQATLRKNRMRHEGQVANFPGELKWVH